MTDTPTSIPPAQSELDQLHASARDIFTSALAHCNIGEALDRHLHFEDTTLVHHPYPGLQHILPAVRIPLDTFKHLRIIAFGKAASSMLDSLLARLPKALTFRAICASPQKQSTRNWRIRYFHAGHPRPNEQSFQAARAALRMLHRADAGTFVFFLISGGGSSILELPLDDSISLDDTIAFHEALVTCGASIHEINVVRKRFSAVKGGRLALAAPAATKLTLQIADVPLRSLDALASGPTIPDRSSPEECREILDRYQLLDHFPPSIRSFFSTALLEADSREPHPGPHNHSSLPATATAALRRVLRPRMQVENLPQPPGFGSLYLDTLLSSHDLVNAARDRAQQLGFKVVIDNSCDDWDYAAAADYLVRRMVELRRLHPRLCLISSGEVTVRVITPPGVRPGTGGRNQQFVLAAALALHQAQSAEMQSDAADARQPVTCIFSVVQST